MLKLDGDVVLGTEHQPEQLGFGGGNLQVHNGNFRFFVFLHSERVRVGMQVIPREIVGISPIPGMFVARPTCTVPCFLNIVTVLIYIPRFWFYVR